MSNDLKSETYLPTLNAIDLKEVVEFGLLSVRGDLGSKKIVDSLKSSIGLVTPAVRKFASKGKVEVF